MHNIIGLQQPQIFITFNISNTSDNSPIRQSYALWLIQLVSFHYHHCVLFDSIIHTSVTVEHPDETFLGLPLFTTVVSFRISFLTLINCTKSNSNMVREFFSLWVTYITVIMYHVIFMYSILFSYFTRFFFLRDVLNSFKVQLTLFMFLFQTIYHTILSDFAKTFCFLVKCYFLILLWNSRSFLHHGLWPLPEGSGNSRKWRHSHLNLSKK